MGCRGTTADIGDNLLPSLTVFGCSLTAVEVETGPLSDVVFPSFLLPSSFSFSWYSETSLIRSPMGLPKSDLNGEVTVLQGVKLHCRIQLGTENG